MPAVCGGPVRITVAWASVRECHPSREKLEAGCEDSPMDLDDLLPEIPTPDWETLSDGSAVGEAAFELLKAAAVYAHLAAGLLPTDGYTRDEAILAGLVVKVSKLGKRHGRHVRPPWQ